MEAVKIDDVELILVGLASSHSYFELITPFKQDIEDIFSQSHLSSFVSWCIEFHQKHGEAPVGHLHDYYKGQLKTLSDEGLEILERILNLVANKAAQPLSVAFMVEATKKIIKRSRIEDVLDSVETALDNDDIDHAEKTIKQLSDVDRTATAEFLNPFSDKAVELAFKAVGEPVFTIGGALGDIMNPLLIKNGLVCVLGPEKRTKTWTMTELAMRAAFQRKRVAFFQVGDLSEGQFAARILTWCSGRSSMGEVESFVSVADCENSQNNTCPFGNENVFCADVNSKELFPDGIPAEYIPCTQCRYKMNGAFKPTYLPRKKHVTVPAMTEDCAKKAIKTMNMRTKGAGMRIHTCANDTINVSEIDCVLKTWRAQDGWVPDVILIDYADILKDEDVRADFRIKEGKKWARLRRLSQEWCLTITATQAGRQANEKDMVMPTDQSENIHKNAHLTAMIGLHQTDEERADCVIRIGAIMMREGLCDVYRQALVFQNLSKGQMHVDSLLIRHKHKKK